MQERAAERKLRTQDAWRQSQRTDKKDEVQAEGSKIKVTAARLMRVMGEKDIKWFSKAYDESEPRIEKAAEDGYKRSMASMTELISGTLLEMIATTKLRHKVSRSSRSRRSKMTGGNGGV